MKPMNEITIPKTTITDEQLDYNLRQLAMKIVYQAVQDYCRSESAPRRKAILKDLRSDHMDFMSGGMSVITADQLEVNYDAIKARIMKDEDDC